MQHASILSRFFAASRRGGTMANDIEYSGNSFPYTVADERKGTAVMLYAEAGRASITYRMKRADGTRTKKQRLPTALPAEIRRIPESNRVPTALIAWAHKVLDNMVAEATPAGRVLEQKLREPNKVSISYVFDHILRSEYYRGLRHDRQTAMDKVMRTAKAIILKEFGPSFTMDQWDQDVSMALIRVRTQEGIIGELPDGGARVYEPTKYNTARQELGTFLGKLFDEATRIKDRTTGRFVLDHHPFQRVKLEGFHERKPKQLVRPDRYELMREHADEIDPRGRFRLLLSLSRWTARRLETLVQLRRDMILTTHEEIYHALEGSLSRYIPDDEYAACARLWAGNYGAIYIPHWLEKGARDGHRSENSAHYDRVFPIGPALRADIEHYLTRHWGEYEHLLGSDGPLFPKEKNVRAPLYKDLPNKWWERCEYLIRAKSIELRKLEGTRWHGLRYYRRGEMKKRGVHVLDTRYITGGTMGVTAPSRTRNGPDADDEITVAEAVYTLGNAQDLLKAACAGDRVLQPA